MEIINCGCLVDYMRHFDEANRPLIANKTRSYKVFNITTSDKLEVNPVFCFVVNSCFMIPMVSDSTQQIYYTIVDFYSDNTGMVMTVYSDGNNKHT